MCMIDDGEMCSVWNQSERNARKQHSCGECGRAIMPGERYRNIFSVYDGHAGDSKACRHCMVAQDWLQNECGGFLLGGVAEDIHEHFQAACMGEDLPAMWLGRVVVGMRRRWVKKGSLQAMNVPALPAEKASALPPAALSSAADASAEW